MISFGGRGEAAAVALLSVGCKDGVGRGVRCGGVRGWRWPRRAGTGTSLQINCPFCLSGYCHKRGAEVDAWASACA